MDRAVGWFTGLRKRVAGAGPAVAQAARLWSAEILESRVLMSAASTTSASQIVGSSSAVFIKNQGQWSDPNVKYAYQSGEANILMTDSGPLFQVFGQKDGSSAISQFLVQFQGANTVDPTGIDLSSAKFNFQVGDQSDWRTGVVGYNEIAYKGIYNGIDLYTWGQRDNLKYEFHVAPGADPSQVKVHYSGISGLTIDQSGNLHIKTATGELVDDAPVVYQMIDGKKVLVKSQFELLNKNTYSFKLDGKYDPTKELILDPTLSWTVYLGGTSAEVGNGVTTDANNNIYVTGSTTSTDFPTFGPLTGQSGSYTIAPGAGADTDVFVAKFDSSGVMQWGTFLGGTAADAGQELVTDNSGNLYVVGQTASADIPLQGTIGMDYGGGTDAFLAAITASTGTVEYGGYIGGSGTDTGSSVDIGPDGSIYIGGQTASTNFPNTLAFQAARSGGSDGFVVKFDPVGHSIAWSTYLGGNNTDSVTDLAVDSSGNIDVVGTTMSTSGLATLGAFSTTNSGNTDAFVAQITQFGSGPMLSWATYLGGSAAEVGNGIAVSKTTASDIWVTGSTAANSTDFPLDNPPAARKGNTDAFVSSFSPDGTTLTSSRLLDTNNADVGNSIAIDSDGNVVVVGNTGGMAGNNPQPLPVTNAIPPGGFSPAGGQNDGFIAYFNVSDATASFVSYFGSTGNDQLNAVTLDGSGGIVAIGTTSSSDLPLGTSSLGAQTTYLGGNDAFIMRVAPTVGALRPAAPTNLSASAISLSQIKLTWVDNATNETSYIVMRGLSRTTLQVVANLPANTKVYTDSGLDPDTTYFYQVLAANRASPAGNGSNIAHATTQTADMAAPSNLTATVISAKQINLQWTDNSTNDNGFEIWRQDTSLGDFQRIGTVGAGTTTYHDQDPALAPNTEYSYQVRAVNAYEESDFSNPAIVTTPSASFIVAPTDLAVTVLTNPAGNLLTWTDNSDNEDHYSIERADAGSNNFVVIGATASLSNAHTFVDSNIVAGHFYTYRVRGVNGADTSAYSNLATSDLDHALAAPSRLDAVAISNSSIELTWTNNAIIQTGFIIERAVNAPSDWIVIKTTGSKATSFVDKHLLTNKRYYYRVTATNGANNSQPSSQATDITFPVATLTAPAAPSNLKAAATGPNSIQLTWKDNSIDETSFKIERSLSPDGPFSIAGSTGVNGKSFIDTKKLKAGTTYYYQVRAWNGRFKSLTSNLVQVTTAAPAKKAKKALAVVPAGVPPIPPGTFSTTHVTGDDLMLEFDLL